MYVWLVFYVCLVCVFNVRVCIHLVCFVCVCVCELSVIIMFLFFGACVYSSSVCVFMCMRMCGVKYLPECNTWTIYIYIYIYIIYMFVQVL